LNNANNVLNQLIPNSIKYLLTDSVLILETVVFITDISQAVCSHRKPRTYIQLHFTICPDQRKSLNVE